jgi:hypothetical protein
MKDLRRSQHDFGCGVIILTVSLEHQNPLFGEIHPENITIKCIIRKFFFPQNLILAVD